MRILIVMLCLSVLACERENQGSAAPCSPSSPHEAYTGYPDHFDSAWVMSANWHGHMGVALAIQGEEYYYWMYADIAPFQTGPYRGRFSVVGDYLILGNPSMVIDDESGEEPSLYSQKWIIIRDPLEVRLVASKDGIKEKGRYLLPDTHFDPKHPFGNQPLLNP